MLAYQMIYTACGKDKSGAFSVWTKSPEVSKQECDEIIKLMNYRKPKNAPYDPTPEELKGLFPPKYAFFDLSTGRKCIAQSSYIGNVYSELDGRSGNFLIHAYVFDKLDNINPFFIFDFAGFKSELTYAEWHDNPAPDSLPAKEIDVAVNTNSIKIRELLNTVPNNSFSMLLESIITCVEKDSEVIFVDTEEKQRLLYKVMGLLLPKNIISKATFSTQYSPQSEYAIQSIGGVPVKIRNIFDSGVPNGINLQEAMDSGKLVFSFDKNIFSTINIGAYVEGIVNDAGTKNMFAVLSEVDSIDKIMTKVQCDVNMAYSIYKFINNEYSFFKSIEEFLTIFKKASENGYLDVNTVPIEIYNSVIKKNMFGKGKITLPLLSQIYNVASKEVKEIIILDFFNSLNEYIKTGSKEIVEQFKEVAPFTWNDFAECVISLGYFNKYSNRLDSFAKTHLIYRAALEALEREFGNSSENENIVINIFNKSLQIKSVSEVAILIRDGNAINNRFEAWILNRVIKNVFCTPVASEKEMQFVFELIDILGVESKEQAIGWIVKSNLKSPYLLPNYIRSAEKFRTLYEKVERKLSTETELKIFFMKKDAYLFQNNAQVNASMLEEYFNKFYLTGYDNGAYRKKLAGYLSMLEGTKKINECLRQCDKLWKLSDGFCDVLDVYRVIENEIYKIPLNELLKLHNSQIQRLSELNNKLLSHGVKTSGKYEILYVMVILVQKFGKSYSEQILMKGELYKSLTSNHISVLLANHLKLVFEFYFMYRKVDGIDINMLLRNIFGYLYRSEYDFDRCFVENLNALKDKEYYVLMTDFMAYAFCQKDNFSSTLEVFINRYCETLKKSEYKRLFSQVKKQLEDTREFNPVDRFIDAFLEQHKGFIEKLFAKKRREN